MDADHLNVEEMQVEGREPKSCAFLFNVFLQAHLYDALSQAVLFSTGCHEFRVCVAMALQMARMVTSTWTWVNTEAACFNPLTAKVQIPTTWQRYIWVLGYAARASFCSIYLQQHISW